MSEQPACECADRGARFVDFAEGDRVVEHLPDCAWVAWFRGGV